MFRILVVDDSKEIRQIVITRLSRRSESVGGLELVEVSSAEEALGILEKGEKIDAILSDNNMGVGKLSGVQFLSRIRRDPRFAGVRFVMMSADNSLELEEACQHFGVNFIHKVTFTTEDLLAALLNGEKK